MPILIHLNGPPGVGKSTLARRYVADHPGSLNLDIDTVASLIGGWRQDFFGVLPAARNIAVAMAETHLRSGADVVLPQLLMIADEVRRFELAAERAGAAFVEVALSVGPVEQMNRFAAKAQDSEVNLQIDRAVAAEGGVELLEHLRRRLDTYLTHRPAASLLDTTAIDVSESYAQLLAILNGGRR
jgi:predicted kinase